MNSTTNKMDTNLTGMWVSFFTTAGIPSDVSATYALTFAENRIQNDMLLDLNKEYLRDMGISRMGDVIAILRHAKQVHESTARDRVLSTTAITNKVPVAAVTGRSTVAQPCSSPASRILEHYTRNPQAPETPQATAVKLKRKAVDVGSEIDMNIKRSRMIRFGSLLQKSPVLPKENKNAVKNTVFSRLGNSDVAPVASPKPVPKPAAKQIYSRLGTKPPSSPPTPPPSVPEQIIPVPKDALKYEGILKGNAPVAKGFTVTTSKNSARKVAVSCTMRADETPVSVKDKLALPKAKSVKFSNTIEYKEIEMVKKNAAIVKQKTVQEKFTPVFNKPERRLCMPEPVNNVKERLGAKNTTKNFTITRNVFNRLGA